MSTRESCNSHGVLAFLSTPANQNVRQLQKSKLALNRYSLMSLSQTLLAFWDLFFIWNGMATTMWIRLQTKTTNRVWTSACIESAQALTHEEWNDCFITLYCFWLPSGQISFWILRSYFFRLSKFNKKNENLKDYKNSKTESFVANPV